jgi:PAS domain S-box-containing protein
MTDLLRRSGLEGHEQPKGGTAPHSALPGPLPVGIFVTDAEGECLSVNSRWCEITGLTPEEARGQGWARALDPRDRERVQREWDDAARRAVAFESRYRFRRPDGSTTWVLGQALAQRDSEGNVTGFIGTITDFSKVREFEESVGVSEERLRLSLDAASATAWDWNVGTGEVVLDPRWIESLGYGPADSPPDATSIIPMIHPEDVDRFRELVKALLEARLETLQYEFRLLARSGETRWRLVLGRVATRSSDGKPLRVVGVEVDITERKRDELESARRQEQLRSLAAQLTLAEERERERIAAGLHDELGQILAIVKVRLAALRGSTAPGEIDQRTREIRELLDEAIRQTRSLTFELSSPILKELGLESAIRSLSDRMDPGNDVRVHVRTDRRPKPLSADVGVLLYRAVRELLLNVVKHAQAHQVEISVGRVGDQIRILVGDDGVGFDVSQADQLAPTGGFGLFSIQEGLGHIGGRLEIDSAPGKGTRALLIAPLAEAGEREA